MKVPALLCASLAALSVVSACSRQSPLEEAALAGEPFTLDRVLGGEVAKAYAFCEYTDKNVGAGLGFDPDDFFSMDDNYSAWETHTGIGVRYSDGRDPEVEWFDPRSVDACPEGKASGEEIDPRAEIGVNKQEREFNAKTHEVAVLSYE